MLGRLERGRLMSILLDRGDFVSCAGRLAFGFCSDRVKAYRFAGIRRHTSTKLAFRQQLTLAPDLIVTLY